MTLDEIKEKAPKDATHYVLYKNGVAMYLNYSEREFTYYDKIMGCWINGAALLIFDKQTMESIGSI